MRFAWKFIVALTLGMVVVLGANGFLRVRRELAVFETDMRRDHEVVSRILMPSLRAAFRRGGEAAVVATIAEHAHDVRLSFRWIDPTAARRPADADWRHHVFPVEVDGVVIGAIELSERRDDVRAYLRQTVVHILLHTGLLALLAAAIVIALTFVLVGRPVRLLRDRTRRIARGDLSGALQLAQRDEIGDLARDMDKMCEDLGVAHQRAELETRERIRAIEQLRHADRLASVGTLASGIAHELGTPLGIVLGRARLIEEDASLSAEAAASARVIADQVQRMDRIIRQLLDFARTRRPADGGPAARDRIELRALAAVVVSLLQPMAQKKSVTLEIVDGDPAHALGDDGLVQQVIVNLAMNGIQALRQPGWVRLGMATEQVTPPQGLALPKGAYVRLWVEDSGPGIADTAVAHIFEPFFTTKEPGEGTGLGLSVAWGIVREHGGWIAVDSVPGRPTRFDLFVPASVG